MLMVVTTTLIFGGALVTALFAMAVTIGEGADRMLAVVSGRADAPFAPLATLVKAERRIEVRRWAGAPRVASVRWREAA